MRPVQIGLFDGLDLPPGQKSVLECYAQKDGALGQSDLYTELSRRCGDERLFARKERIGRSGASHSKAAREVRWHQQTLKANGWLERVPGLRGHWRLSDRAKAKLTAQEPGVVMLGHSTDLGVCLWASAQDVFSHRLHTDEPRPITLILTSPPYPLARPRAYGNVALSEYVAWLVDVLRPIVAQLRDGGTVALNVSNDIFEPGSPARSTYRERLVIALCDELGLFKWDEFIWHNPSKPPGPVQWASRTQQQLNVAWEPVYIFTNNPIRCLASNRRVLEQHTKEHLSFMQRGGNRSARVSGDGAYRVRPGAYGRVTDGRIPKNLQAFAHRSSDDALTSARKAARELGLPLHGAPMPLGLASFMVRYLTAEGDLVVDPFAGWCTTGAAAEMHGRRWLCTEKHLEYVYGSALRFAAMDAS